MEEWKKIYDPKNRKIVFFIFPYGKQIQFRFNLEYYSVCSPKECDVDRGRGHGYSVYMCVPVDGLDKGGTKRPSFTTVSPIYPRLVSVVFMKRNRLIGIRKLMRVLDFSGDSLYWIKRMKQMFNGIRFRGRNLCLGASLGFGNYGFLRVQSSFHRGENTYFLYNIDYVARFPYRDMVYDLMAVLLKWIEVEPPLSQYGREHVGVFQMYWGLMETELGVKPVDEGGNLARHYAYRVYRVRDILDVIGEERVRNTVFIGLVTIENDARDKPVFVFVDRNEKGEPVLVARKGDDI